MAKYQIPESIADLDAEGLAAAREAAKAEIERINGTDGDLPVEDLEMLEQLLDHVDAVDARATEIAAEEQALTDRLTAARERAAKVNEPESQPETEGDPEPEPEPEVVDEPADAEPVLASGQRRNTVARAAKKAPAVIIPKDEESSVRRTVITAAANVPEFNSNQELKDLGEVAQAFAGRVSGRRNPSAKEMQPGTYQMSPNAVRAGVARIKRDEGEFAVDRQMSLEEQFQVLMDASNENRFSGQSVIAAGGWCAPSETIYELFGYETNEGLLDIPEVTARRGGISFTKGPDFMTVFTDPDAGFIMTEAQAEAGTFTKPCYALECPDFTEVRLDAIGFCATAPLLTDAAYPELTRRVLGMLGLGHQRRKSQSTITRISTSIGAALAWGAVGGTHASGVADALAGLELQAIRIRQSLAMSTTATIEGIAPHWLRAAFRNELARRLSLTDPFRISDADVDSWLALRNIRLQYVYDYQMLTAGNTANWTAYPTTVDIMLYPAGAYTRLVNDVISLDAVYDHDLLTQNEYTAAFVEEGIAVANTRGYGVKITIPLRYEGSAGFPAIGSGAGVTFAAA